METQYQDLRGTEMFDFLVSRLDDRYFDDRGVPLNNITEFKSVIAGLKDLLMKPEMRGLRNDMRAKMKRFVSNGDVPFGMSNVDVMGNYLVGDKPSKANDTQKRSSRLRGQQSYFSALVLALNATLKDRSFVLKEDSNYDSREDALLALEADSISSKGPYDNGKERQAIDTVNSVLSGVLSHAPLNSDLHGELGDYISDRLGQLSGYVDRSFSFSMRDYVEYMKGRGLKETMRGFPFYVAGNSNMKDYFYTTTAWMFEGVEFDLPSLESSLKMTIDEFTSEVLHRLIEAGIKGTTWFNLKQGFIEPISRNQGSAWKTEVEDSITSVTGDRKAMKYRLVTPMCAFTQAYCIMGTTNYITTVVQSRGRVGLQSPDINKARMNEFIHLAEEMDQILVSTDFTAYDSTVIGQLLALFSVMNVLSYDDEWVQDSFVMMATSMCQKIMILPSDIDGAGGLYDNLVYEELNEVKGDKNFGVKKDNQFLSGEMAEVNTPNDFDYRALAFYIYSGYLPSGHIGTNSIGSEITLGYGKVIVPHWLYQNGHITLEEKIAEVLAIGSGDDLVQGIAKRLFDLLGYWGVMQLLERAYDDNHMQVKAEKQIKILLNDLPLVDFLQQVMFQQQGPGIQEFYKKILRQIPAAPYTERYSKLPIAVQWVIVLGKLESGLCSENTDFAAEIIIRAGEYANLNAVATKYKAPISPAIRGSRHEFTWEDEFAVQNSNLLGLGQLCGLVKNYSQGTLSALGKYVAELDSVGNLIKTFDAELETRAPHRAVLAKAVYDALGSKFNEEVGERIAISESESNFYFYSVELIEKLIERTSELVNPIVLEKPINGVGILDQVEGFDEEVEDPDDYEI